MGFYERLLNILKADGRFFTAEGELLRNAVYQAAMAMDGKLIKALYADEETRSRFFAEVEGAAVFDKMGFAWTVNNRSFLPDSYTRYKNKIGLADSRGDFIAGSNDVELVFPYKDCVLEGGQTKEDRKRSEVFYNRTLAPDEVDRLLSPKVFTRAVRHTGTGQKPVETLSPEDNLVIKGNNLLALASLLPVYKGRVKLIYIDPPYNTENDTFSYNDHFSRSSWLVFMKNRLELAQKLLAPEGAIYVQLDYHQVHYAKVLMDEIFGEENFQREIIWRIGWLSGYKTRDNNWIRNHDTILFYSKDPQKLDFQKQYIPREEFKKGARDSTARRYPIEDVWNGSEYDDLNSIAIVSFAGETVSKLLNKEDEVKGQKPEKLLERILEAHTKPGDLVLDFFAGSGTTAAAAHKMGRRYIVCEQLPRHMDILCRRLDKVIEGEGAGISRRQNWQGGGSFVYCELAELNSGYADRIQQAEDSEILAGIWTEMNASGFISSRVDPRDIDPAGEDFRALALDEQKRLLMDLLDLNYLYVNYCDIEDETFAISEADKAFTRQFYREG